MNKKTPYKPKQPPKKQLIKQPVHRVSRKKLFISLGLILLITALVFSNTIMHRFLTWDDQLLVPDNLDIRALTMHSLHNFFTKYYIGMYQPLTTLIYAVTYHFFKLDPHPYHAVNLLIHLINVALVFWLVYIMTDRLEPAVIVAFFFGIHPMHVESVAWIAELKDVLYGLFFILSLCFYVLYIKRKNKPPIHLYIFSLLSFILSCFSKSAAVVLPLVLIVFDYYYSRKINTRTIIEKIPFFIFSIVFGIVSLKTQSGQKAITNITPLFSIADRFFLVCYAASFYFVKLFFPLRLSALHYYPLNFGKPLPTLYYLSPLLLILIAIIVIFSRKYRKLLLFGIFFFFSSIILVLQIIPVGQALVAERYTYIPYIGLFFIFGKLYSDVVQNKVKNAKKIKPYFTAVLIVFAIAFCYATYQRNKLWKDTETLFTDVINKNPDIFYSYTVRGGAYILDKQYDKGIHDYETSIKLQPGYYDAYFNIGKAYYNLGDYAKAIGYYNKSIELRPGFAESYSDRAAVYFITGHFNETIADCNKALKLNPGLADAYINRGSAEGALKQYAASIEDFNKGLAINPYIPDAYINRGLSKINLGRKDEACSDFNYAYSLGAHGALSLINKYCK